MSDRIAWWQRIRFQLLGFGVMMSIIPLLALGWANINAARTNLEVSIQRQNTAAARWVAGEIYLSVKNIWDKLEAVTGGYGGSLLTMDNHERERILYSLLKTTPLVEEMAVVDAAGVEWTRVSRRRVVVSTRAVLSSAGPEMVNILAGRRGVGRVFLEGDGRPMANLVVPLFDGTGVRVVGGLVAQINLRGIVDNTVSGAKDKSGYLFVVDDQGRLLSHEDFSQVLQNRDVTGSAAVGKLLAGVNPADLPTPHSYQSYTGREVLGVFSPIEDLGWGVVIEQPAAEAFAPVRGLLWKFGLATALVMAAVTSISIFFGIKFTGPIQELQQGTQRIITGHLDHALQVKAMGEIGSLVAAFNQMTRELKIKSDSLLAEKSRLDTVVSGIGAGLALVGKEGRINWVNTTLAGWFGGGENVVGKFCPQPWAESETACGTCPVLCGDSGPESREVVHFIKLGEKNKYFRHRVFPLHPGSEAGAGYLVVIEDITERREMEAAICQADKLAAVGLLAAGVAHEINNPMNTVAAYTEDLLERLNAEPAAARADEAEITQYLDIIRQQVNRCTKITRNLVSFARQSKGEQQLVEINELLRETAALIHFQAKSKQLNITQRLEPGSLWVMADRGELQQVFLNLLQNAVDATGAGGEIRINTCLGEQGIDVAVADTGCGIPEEHQNLIFDPFFTTKPVGKGTGLGLSVCYGILAKLGGRIRVQSREGEGTVFTVTLPPAKKDTKEVPTHEHPSQLVDRG